jgi:hypothetical protein
MSMFSNAPVAEAKKPAKAKAKTEYVPTPGLELFAALCAVEKNILAQKAVVRTDIDATAMERFIDEGMRRGVLPESYKGAEGKATGSIQLRCRSSASGLSEDEQALLEENNIPLDRNVQREETFIINPAYADLSDEQNAAMLQKVELALSKLGLPADFIQRQTAVEKVIATEESINAVFKLKDRATVEALVPLVTCQALRPTLSADANPFDIVEQGIGSPTV